MVRSAQADDGEQDSELQPNIVESGKALASVLQTTLGPNGMDKMLVGRNGKVVVTNTGANIIRRMEIDDPVGRIIKDSAEAQNRRICDGTTTTILLVGQQLDEADSLQKTGVHPTKIVDGYSQATEYARERLQEYKLQIDRDDSDLLRHIAATTVTGRWNSSATDRFADLTVSALRAVDFNMSRLTLHGYPGGGLRDSELLNGILVDMEKSSTSIDIFETDSKRTYDEPQIALVNAEISFEKPDTREKVTITNPDQLNEIRKHEKEVRSGLVESVLNSGADVLFCQKSIDDAVRTTLSQAGVLTVERTRQDEFDAIARATDATTVMSVGDLTADTLGTAGKIQRVEVGQTEALTITDCPEEKHASLVLRGGTPHVMDETQRIIADCIEVVRLALKDGAVLPGGGATATALAQDVSAYADSITGRNQLAFRAFSNVLAHTPYTLARNAGKDPVDTQTELRRHHHVDESTIGIDESGALRDMRDAGVLEPVSVFDTCLVNAIETTSRILKIDDVIEYEAADSNQQEDHTHTETSRSGEQTSGYPWALSH